MEDTPVFILRHGDGLHALHNRCSHRGCSLAGGEIDGESIVCPCHGPRFSLHDGSVEGGPATSRQPAYEVRESGGRSKSGGSQDTDTSLLMQESIGGLSAFPTSAAASSLGPKGAT